MHIYIDIHIYWYLLIFIDIYWWKDFKRPMIVGKSGSRPEFLFRFESWTEGELPCVWQYSAWYWVRANKRGGLYDENRDFNQQEWQWNNKHVDSISKHGG